MIILNVGLKIDALGDEFNTDSICSARSFVVQQWLDSLGYDAKYKFNYSETELTLIVSILNPDNALHSSIAQLSDVLGQDCIALYNPELNAGKLVGIHADKWGEFNKDYFLMP